MKKKDSIYKGILLPLIGLILLLLYAKPPVELRTKELTISEINSENLLPEQAILTEGLFYQETRDHLIFIDLYHRRQRVLIDKWTLNSPLNLVIGQSYELEGKFDGYQLIDTVVNPLVTDQIKQCTPIKVRELQSMTEVYCDNGIPIGVSNNLFPRHIRPSDMTFTVEYEEVGNSISVLRVQ